MHWEQVRPEGSRTARGETLDSSSQRKVSAEVSRSCQGHSVTGSTSHLKAQLSPHNVYTKSLFCSLSQSQRAKKGCEAEWRLLLPAAKYC